MRVAIIEEKVFSRNASLFGDPSEMKYFSFLFTFCFSKSLNSYMKSDLLKNFSGIGKNAIKIAIN